MTARSREAEFRGKKKIGDPSLVESVGIYHKGLPFDLSNGGIE